MLTLIKNIKLLAGILPEDVIKVSGKEMSSISSIEDAYLVVEDDLIRDYGKMELLKTLEEQLKAEGRQFMTIDATGKTVLPAFCDSHSHLVYAASREGEFVDRINGLTYQDIAKRGGGILSSVKKLRDASEEELFESAWKRLDEIMFCGTGAVEIKSGYGLNPESELKMLRVIAQLKAKHPVAIRSTFLGAHAIPEEYKSQKEKYIALVTDEMIPAITNEKLADFCDVFCEEGYFTKAETIRVLEAGKKYGLIPKIHAEQLSHSGGIEAGVETGAASVDHLEYCNDHDIALLKNSDVMPTLLPGAQFFLQLPHPPARKMIDAGLPVAIASDFNPGSSPCGNMNTMISLACIQYKMTPEEALQAATINSSFAMGLNETHGSITKGKKANLIITKEIPSLAFLPYSFGSNLIESILINGIIQTKN